ncbi:nitrilase [Amycolatopsis mediterranei S699]|uniref:Nitrilase n=2 Tax=Amycolatopsis mediterranei TaxID=33910 RepID=A0A0H3DG75_AMYMU|nr:carbon-nitrogen hydrolase family protein [Amycolatopsis mediterranei]ADJ48664.1 nitrilase [Amycolatopsis mediterranei U32]AEK45599.1 nitrilase [Amycolatopsis mediterranei S699]AFO80373.1 nitrilase [Amycolatopsis mediterranei S699]AGT87501.1 nitrilase [Amycolatopsis mediterranei RB]KDO03879.1 carbon-nitrogen hydrolase [Amycolatopsis mediterranei]
MRVAVHQGPLGDLPRIDADLVVTAEMITTGYHIGVRTHELAEPADGPTAARMSALARQLGTALAYGYPETDGEHVYNSVQLVDATGRRLANYRKTHLFGDLDNAWFTPGDEAVVQADLGGLRIGLLICYDVEFPELVRAHALAGTELLVVPTALMSPYELVADTLVPARAYESQLFVAYANRCDTERELTYCGRSCVVAPTGEVLARAGSGPEVIAADVTRDALAASRLENTHLADRRPELYRGTTA